MMDASQSLPKRVSATQDHVRPILARISEILEQTEGQTPTGAQIKELTEHTVAIELAAVDIFSVFEARMQRHFKRGPLSRKVKAALLAAGQPDLADRLHQHYMAINVLKHGTGASHRELMANVDTLFVVKPATDAAAAADETDVSTGLIDVTAAGFFDGLTETILEAYEFLESR